MTSRELPRYQSHKQVWALKISGVLADSETPGATLVPVEDGYAPFHVTAEYMSKHNPQPGGYYVVYEDGYCSFSPATAFENGYTKIN